MGWALCLIRHLLYPTPNSGFARISRLSAPEMGKEKLPDFVPIHSHHAKGECAYGDENNSPAGAGVTGTYCCVELMRFMQEATPVATYVLCSLS